MISYRLQGTRREILRYGSLGVAVSCLLFATANWKAMQYASPKAILNLLFGVSRPSFGENEGESKSARIQQFVNYISDLEASSPPVFQGEEKNEFTQVMRAEYEMREVGSTREVEVSYKDEIEDIVDGRESMVQTQSQMLDSVVGLIEFTVVGVHSAKFDNEKDLEAIRSAVLRYDITHPVVNDEDMYLWRELGISSWPTFALVGPNGKLLAQIAGEGHRKDLDDLVEAALRFYGEKQILQETPIPLSLEKDNDPRLLSSPLKFPGKLAVDVLNNRLFISDSGNGSRWNFIVQIGSTGEEGLLDGNFDDATFNRPQGLAYNPKKNVLYVADTENHALREIDFANESVRTLAGNGTKGSTIRRERIGTTQA
ncbi:hypothetical protein GIB67_043095, partial [Kingdonia uniflora]